MDSEQMIIELCAELTNTEIFQLKQYLHLPLEINQSISNATELLSALKTWKDHRPFRFYKALQAIQPDVIPMATDIPWLCDETDDNQYELDHAADLLFMKALLQLLVTEIPTDKWGNIYTLLTQNSIANMKIVVTMKMLFEKGFIKVNLIALSDIIKQIGEVEVANKVKNMRIYFMTIEEGEFKKLFEEAIASIEFESG